MHAQSTTTPAQAEATPARAEAAMLLATGNKSQRRKVDYQFPQACTPEVHQAWKAVAKDVKKLHDAVSNGRTKVGDDPGVVGEAYRKACRAGHRDSGVSAQMAAHVSIETIAKSFVTDGTYAKMAINPTGISYVAGLVGELQNRSRNLNLEVGLGGLAIDAVFFRKNDVVSSSPTSTCDGEFDARVLAWEALTVRYEEARAAEGMATSQRDRDKWERATSKLLDELADQVRQIVNLRTTDPRMMLRKYEIIQKELYNTSPDAVASDLASRVIDPEHDHWDGECLVDGIMADIYALANKPPGSFQDRTAWDAAVAHRDQIRADMAAYSEREGRDPPQEQQDALSDAEFAVYTTPAPDLAAVLWKLADNMKDDWGSGDLSAILAGCDSSGDLGEVAQASVYRDIQRLAGPVPQAHLLADDPSVDFDLLSAVGDQMQLRQRQESAIKADRVEEAEQHTEAMQPALDRATLLRAKTLAGLMGRVWLVEDWAPTPDSVCGEDLEWKMVRSLLDDIKALFAEQQPKALVGSRAVTAGWIAGAAAQQCGVFPGNADPVAIAAE
ncbi:hypothetical protein [Caulobacter sp. DWP3-1-3b2]|uniref:hypothetical protein n=1 Tax=Caulobacter sp. DWP3-1-3b2 TaxID=2804643 RepID=UPI003CFB95E0